MPIATRLTTAGTLLVNGSFDENTSIAPSKFRTTSNTVFAGTLDEVSLAAGAISFNGSTQYLTGTSPNLSGTWTVEMWCYWTTGGTQTTIVSFNNGSNSGINLWKNSSNQLVADDGVNGVVAMSTVTPTINAWNHIAFVRVGTTTSGYVNGVLAGTTTYTPGTTSAVSVGRYNGSPFYYFPGYISNLRVVNGTAVYTTAFTPPQAILPAVTNTSLLLNATDSSNFIRDNSTNNYTLTNNGTATWIATGPFNQGSTTLKQRQINDGTLEVYSNFDEFTGAPVVDTGLQLWLDAGQTTSYTGTGTTWTDLSGKGNNGTLVNSPTYSTSNGGYFSFGSAGSQRTSFIYQTPVQSAATSFTWNIWTYPVANSDAYVLMGYRGTTPLQFYKLTTQKFEMYPAEIFYLFTLNVWQNICVIYDGTQAGTNNMKMYLNGIQVGLRDADAPDLSPSAMPFFVGGDPNASEFATARIAQVMVYNRALTTDEITTNFNALRGRYGI